MYVQYVCVCLCMKLCMCMNVYICVCVCICAFVRERGDVEEQSHRDTGTVIIKKI